MLLLLIVGLLDGIVPDLQVAEAQWPRPENRPRPRETRPEVPLQPSGYG